MNHPIQTILEAAQYAAEKHVNQRRKGARAEPYVNHVLEVAQLVSQATAEPDPESIVAALLHDTVEDTDVTKEELAIRFGPDVANLVMELTDDKTLPKAERKRLQIQNAPKKSQRAQMIKLADKISNLRSLLASPPANWNEERKAEYFDWAQKVVAGLSSPNPYLKAEFDSTVSEFRKRTKEEPA